MKTSQRGYTLIELILVIGLMSSMTMLSFMEKARDFEIAQAKSSGVLLFQYSNATRAWLSNNVGAANQIQGGSAWLKHTSCSGGLSNIGYLPCSYPAASAATPIKFGQLSLASNITTTGVMPNQVTTVTTTSTPFTIHTSDLRSDLAGVATLVAAAGSIHSSTPEIMATDGKYGSDPQTGIITIITSNNGSNDAWLRTDGSNTMKSNLLFEETKPEALRQIHNVSRVQSIFSEILYLGNVDGALSAQRVIVDADEHIMGKMIVNNDAGAAAGLDVIRGDIRATNGNISSSKQLSAGTSVNAGTSISAGTDIIAGDDIVAGNSMQAQVFYDANDTAYYINPNAISNINELSASGNITANGRIKSGEYLELGGIVTKGSGCTGIGLIATDSSGRLMSCQGGLWESQSSLGNRVQVTGANLGDWPLCTMNYGSGNGKRLMYNGTEWVYSGSGQQLVYCYR